MDGRICRNMYSACKAIFAERCKNVDHKNYNVKKRFMKKVKNIE